MIFNEVFFEYGFCRTNCVASERYDEVDVQLWIEREREKESEIKKMKEIKQ